MLDGICVKGPKDKFVEAFIREPGGRCYYPEKYVSPMEKSKWKDYVPGVQPLVIQGILRGCEDYIWDCLKRQHPFYYLDHAYFHATRDYKPGKWGLLYRVNYTSMNTNTILTLRPKDHVRIQKFKPIDVARKPRQKNGKNILVCPPTAASARIYKLQKGWEDWVVSKIRKHTDRPIKFRPKDAEYPLERDLERAHATVSLNSTAAIKSVLHGVPSFAGDISPAAPVSNKAFSDLDNPWFPDDASIDRWIDSLLATQFTWDEIESGIAYKTIRRLYEQ